MPLEIRQVEKGDIADIARLDQVAMPNVGIHYTIEKVQKEEGVDITYSFERWISTGMEHHAQTFWKVVDTETNEMISVAKFSFQYHEGEAYQDTPIEGEEPPPKRLISSHGSTRSQTSLPKSILREDRTRVCDINSCQEQRVRQKTDRVDEQISHISQHTLHIEDAEQHTCFSKEGCRRPTKQDWTCTSRRP
jgi:hypothetical protein